MSTQNTNPTQTLKVRSASMDDDRLFLIGQLAYCAETKDWKRFNQLIKQHEQSVGSRCAKSALTRAIEEIPHRVPLLNKTYGDYVYKCLLMQEEIKQKLTTLRDNLRIEDL